MNPVNPYSFPRVIYADTDLVCSEEQDQHCRVKYIRADVVNRLLDSWLDKAEQAIDHQTLTQKITHERTGIS